MTFGRGAGVWIPKHPFILALTGAGISKASSIPTLANASVQSALYLGWALAEINHDAEHLVAPFLEREIRATSYA